MYVQCSVIGVKKSIKLCFYFMSRFTDDKFDDRIMESSFAQQQFEEERRY